MSLPAAYLKNEKPLDKLSYYEKAASDSARLRKLMKEDPNYQLQPTSLTMDTNSNLENASSTDKDGLNTSLYGRTNNADSNEAKVYRKLEALNKVINQPASMQQSKAEVPKAYPVSDDAHLNGEDVDRLQQMMQSMNKGDGADSDMLQLNNTLDKILDIQHPERVQQRLDKLSEAKQGKVSKVSAKPANDFVTLLDHKADKNSKDSSQEKRLSQNGFYDLTDDAADNKKGDAIQAVIDRTQTVVNGSTVKLRLTSDLYVDGNHIPKNNFLYGIASLRGERLDIKINSIRYQNSIYPVKLSVYDMDGMQGIYVPGAISRDVIKQSAASGVQNLGMPSLNTSLGGQAASAGIEAAKNLFTKKVKLIKVRVKAGYKVLIPIPSPYMEKGNKK